MTIETEVPMSADRLIGVAGLGVSVVEAARTGEEDVLLIEKFGDKYRAYLRRTGRFLLGSRPEVLIERFALAAREWSFNLTIEIDQSGIICVPAMMANKGRR